MRKSWVIALVSLLALTAASYGGFRLLQTEQVPDGFVYGNGHVEGIEIRVAAEIPGRVVDSTMMEGQLVEAGSVLATLDVVATTESWRSAQAVRRAAADELAALLPQLKNWQHHLENAEREQTRLNELKTRELATAQQLDQASNAVSEARGHVAHLRATVDSANAKLAAATAQEALAIDQRQKVEIRAPRRGTVLIKAVEPGEYVQPGQPVAVLVDMDRLELRIFVSERDLGFLRLGNNARLRVNAFPDQYLEATLARIDPQAQFTPRDIHLPDERARTVYGVTLALNNPDGRLKPGMPADAWIRWQDALPWPATLITPGE